ncbi:MAG: glycosyltransferase family 4 protein, partial [Calditrichaeota bacterium]|nr:glycosyltransferase family 4 protein [Calditrichota bacterium]
NGFPVIHNNARHRFSFRFTNRILTNSKQIKDKYLSFGWINDEIFDVVPNGIRKPETPPPNRSIWQEWVKDSKALIAVFAGRLTTVKRVDDLFDAWAGLNPDSRWHLIVIGAGHLEDHLRERSRDSKLNGKVHIIGYRENAGHLLGTADLVLLPSSEEGMPNTIMEAMSHGVAVVASPVGDTPYLLDRGNAGWIVPVGNSEGYTMLLKRFESNPEELKQMGKRGFDRITSEFSFERMIDGVEASLKQIR